MRANPFSKITFWWIGPIMTTGFRRPLQKEDLWYMDEKRSGKVLAEKLYANFDKRRIAGKPSLTRALNDTFWIDFWLAGVFKLVGDTLQVTSPLVLQAIIAFGTQSYASRQGFGGPDAPDAPAYWRGFVMAIGLFLMMAAGSLCTHQFFQRSMSVGVLARTAIISNVYRKASKLSGKAKASYSNGRITNLMSTDTTRIDFCAGYFHFVWAAPIEALICLGLLLKNLGPSALAGFAFLVLMSPIQGKVMQILARRRLKATGVTDKRVRMVQEILSGMRVIKFYAWEDSFLDRLGELRAQELEIVKSLLVIRSGINAVAQVIPVFGSIITFMVYSINHDLNPSIVFSSVALFNILRMPLMFLPLAITTVTDAYVSLGRLGDFFVQDELDELPPVNVDAKYHVRIEHGDFLWEEAEVKPVVEKAHKGRFAWLGFGRKQPKPEPQKIVEKASEDKEKSNEKVTVVDAKEPEKIEMQPDGEIVDDQQIVIETIGNAEQDEKAEAEKAKNANLHLHDITMLVPRSQLVAIVGPVGSGKSSLLQAMVGEMKRLRGEIEFGGSVGYCPQVSWIQNATLRDNILFGAKFEEQKYRDTLRWCCLEPDLEMLPNGDLTEIGERGITLSGGQKQRINLARAVYQDAPVMLLDDPLSAVDAHVGKYLFETCIAGPAMQGKTRLLVTHQLHVLPNVDMIYTMENGRIVESGTYDELMTRGGAFSRLIAEFGGREQEEEDEEVEDEAEAIEGGVAKSRRAKAVHLAKGGLRQHENGQFGGSEDVNGKILMQQEERETGSVAWSVYHHYIKFAGGNWVPFVLVFTIAMITVTNIGNNLWLSYWSERRFAGKNNGFYMGIYLLWGVAQGVFAFIGGYLFSVHGARAARQLHHFAMKRVIRAPMSFFDTTPLGRIMNRFSKDVDTVDNLLSDSYRMFLMTLGIIVGVFALIITYFHWFALPMVFIIGIFYFASRFYRSTARELKRLDAVLRSTVYSHFSESLTGLATIRAYRAMDRFIGDNRRNLDTENRAYLLTVTVQRWLGIRLDFAGNLLILIVAIFAVVDRFTVSPASIGLVLSYALQVANVFSWMVRQNAEVENNMNSVERLTHYGTSLEVEAPAYVPEKKPVESWPEKGAISIKNLELRYRKDLPLVLKGIDLEVNGGEKIGVVGRTGSGKSSTMLAIYRLVELSGGTISIDGVDIGRIGLHDLRSKLAIIPQDPILFSGTIRSNLDPFHEHTDQELWDSLRRSWLVDWDSSAPKDGDDAGVQTGSGRKFTLDTPVDDEGLNFSQGQKQLLALARALVKNARVIILDEATSSVDYKTDALIQQTIAAEFKDATLLTIAHRLKTIIEYDRVVVMDAGKVIEFDTPANLMATESSVFRGMCIKSGITEVPTKAAERAPEPVEDTKAEPFST